MPGMSKPLNTKDKFRDHTNQNNLGANRKPLNTKDKFSQQINNQKEENQARNHTYSETNAWQEYH
jgi:hypothetical protein